jgi:hypothetical protein
MVTDGRRTTITYAEVADVLSVLVTYARHPRIIAFWLRSEDGIGWGQKFLTL